MSIVYALVSKKGLVEAESSYQQSNYASLARDIIATIKIPETVSERRLTVNVSDEFSFHYIATSDDIVVLCLAGTAFGRRIPFAFLVDILSHVNSQSVIIEELDSKSPLVYLLDEKLEYWNKNPNADKFRLVQSQVGQVKDIMVQNVEKLLERGERLETLQGKTEDLSIQSSEFKARARSVRQSLYWRRVKWVSLMVLLVCSIAGLIFFLVTF